jgi:hypothetical protein
MRPHESASCEGRGMRDQIDPGRLRFFFARNVSRDEAGGRDVSFAPPRWDRSMIRNSHGAITRAIFRR